MFRSILLFFMFLPFSLLPNSYKEFIEWSSYTEPQVNVYKGMNYIEIEVEVPGMEVEKKVAENDTFHVLILEEYPTMLEIGKPALPVIKKVVEIPLSAEISVTVEDTEAIEFQGYNVYPFQKPLIEGEEPGPFEIDTNFYRKDTLYPFNIVKISNPEICRLKRVLEVSF